MKNLLVAVCFVVGVVALAEAAANNAWQYNGNYQEVYAPSYYAVNVSSTGVVKSSAIWDGCYRTYANDGATTVWMNKSTSTAVTSTGIPIYPKMHYVDDMWFGDVYLQTGSGNAANDVRIETIRYKIP